MEFKIGNIKLKNKIVLAPMAGITDKAFRRIIKEFDCGLVFSEMISDKALIYNNQKTMRMIQISKKERPIVGQLFGSNIDTMVRGAIILYKVMKPDIIDINMGCPVPKVAIKSKAGAYLLNDLDKIYNIVSAVVKVVPCPVTVKIRSGWDNNINAVKVAKTCEKAGASAITVHPRTRSQGYRGRADWNIIKLVKEAITIPVIGNGDIKSVEDAKKMLSETNCDAVMIGRGALGNPWLIRDIIYYLKTGRLLNAPSLKEKIEMCKKHYLYMLEDKEERQVIKQIRRHIISYLKGLPNKNNIKEQIFKVTSMEEVFKLLDNYLQE